MDGGRTVTIMTENVSRREREETLLKQLVLEGKLGANTARQVEAYWCEHGSGYTEGSFWDRVGASGMRYLWYFALYGGVLLVGASVALAGSRYAVPLGTLPAAWLLILSGCLAVGVLMLKKRLDARCAAGKDASQPLLTFGDLEMLREGESRVPASEPIVMRILFLLVVASAYLNGWWISLAYALSVLAFAAATLYLDKYFHETVTMVNIDLSKLANALIEP